MLESERDPIDVGISVVVPAYRSEKSLPLLIERLQKVLSSLADSYEVIWSFDSNVVYSAIQFLLARMKVLRPQELSRLETLIRLSTPHSLSFRHALALTTKLTIIMQRQHELEGAIHRISSAITNTLELEAILQSAVKEVGRCLGAQRVILSRWSEGTNILEGVTTYDRKDEVSPDNAKVQMADISFKRTPAEIAERNTGTLSLGGREISGRARITGPLPEPPDMETPLPLQPESSIIGYHSAPEPIEASIMYRGNMIGMLNVEDDTPGRLWEPEEVRMVKTASDQLAVAITNGRLFKRTQTQALTDSLTGLYNHGYFQDHLEREIKLADRNNQQVSLILLDLDHLKRINDTYGHRAGDMCLVHVARIMQGTIREVDTCARYGGEEFVIILPQCGRQDSISVAERLREAIASSPVQNVGQITASIGVATFPSVAKSREELIERADQAMYMAKEAGRNRVRSIAHRLPEAPTQSP